MTPLHIILIVAALLYAVGCAVLVVAVACAPMGWQDSDGFHEINDRDEI